MKDVIIIGAGLSGLVLTYFLKDQGLDILVVEGRERIGGRILTVSKERVQVEMGATWIHPQHKELLALVNDLGLDLFEQYMGDSAFYEPMAEHPHQLVPLPSHQEPSYRIQGGSSVLIESLMQQLEKTRFLFDCKAIKIEKCDQHLSIDTTKGQFKAKQLVSTLPPFLFHKTIETIPALSEEVIDVMAQTSTWMGESIKIALSYPDPFWLKNSSSGTVFSNIGPVTEMYDHSNYSKEKFSLKGFMNPVYHSISKKERLELIIRQLKRYYGEIANKYISYDEVVWKQEPLSSHPYDSALFPHNNNGHQLYRKSFINGRLFIAGSETATSFPGYMEGAVVSAKDTAEKIKTYFTRTGFNS